MSTEAKRIASVSEETPKVKNGGVTKKHFLSRLEPKEESRWSVNGSAMSVRNAHKTPQENNPHKKVPGNDTIKGDV